jgi:hypothetical protein
MKTAGASRGSAGGGYTSTNSRSNKRADRVDRPKAPIPEASSSAVVQGTGRQHRPDDDDDEDSDELTESTKNMGYCHFNEDGSQTLFAINVFGVDLVIRQNPASRSLGHGAVVWDASVILAKYMEFTPKLFNATALTGKTVLELGSGCGLGGICFMMKGARVLFSDLRVVVEELTANNAHVSH